MWFPHPAKPFLAIVLVLIAAGCEREVRKYPVPDGAITTRDGDKFVVIRAGDGPMASSGQIWGVEEKLISHSEPDCPYPCKRYMLRPVSDPYHDDKREWLRTMREGEIRRFWMKGKDGTVRVFEFEMGSVIKTDSAGEPIPDQR